MSETRFRITVRGPGIELRGVITGMAAVQTLSQVVKPTGCMVIASPLAKGELVPFEREGYDNR